jgi:hypothetical protein
VAGLRAYNSQGRRPCKGWVGFYFVSVSSRVSPTNSERTSPLIYPADPSGLRIVRDQVSSWAHPGFLWNPHLLIVVLVATGGRSYVGLDCINCISIPLSILLLLLVFDLSRHCREEFFLLFYCYCWLADPFLVAAVDF